MNERRDAFRRLLRELEELIEELCADRHRRHSVILISGPQGDYATMLNLKAGQSGTAIATFQDNTQTPPVSYPLASAATWTADDSALVLTPVKDGTADGVATCTVAVPAGHAPGPFNLTCVGQGEADGSDTITGTYAGAVLAPDDNAVVMTSTVP